MTDIEITTESIDTTETDRRRAYVQGLRELASFIEASAALPCPYGTSFNAFVNNKADLADIARSGTRWDKGVSGNYFFLRKEFAGGHTYEINVNREQVCRKVVTGTEIVPAQPEQVVETVEWICDEPLLVAASN